MKQWVSAFDFCFHGSDELTSKVNQSLKIWHISVDVIFTFKNKHSSGVNDMHAEVFREKCTNVSKK